MIKPTKEDQDLFIYISMILIPKPIPILVSEILVKSTTKPVSVSVSIRIIRHVSVSVLL